MQSWKEVLPVDQYLVKTDTVLHDFDRRFLSLVYQPLIGPLSFSLYMLLWSELEAYKYWGSPSTHKSIMESMRTNLDNILVARYKLEGIGLLKTYVQKTTDVRNFIYDLQPPLSPAIFFSSEFPYSIFLKNEVGEFRFNKLKSLFVTKAVNQNDFQNISKSFSDIFETTRNQSQYMNGSLEEDHQEFIHREEKGMEKIDVGTLEFDFDQFIYGLSKNFVPRHLITDEVEKRIKLLAYVYGFSPLDMQKVVLDATSSDEEEIDLEVLSQKAKVYYDIENYGRIPSLSYKIQPLDLQTMRYREPKTEEEKRILHFETTSPKDFLSELAGGAMPTGSDLSLVESIMENQKLEPGVVNVLLYYVVVHKKMNLNRNYMTTTASNWARLKVRTVKEALDQIAEFEKNVIEYKEKETKSKNNQNTGLRKPIRKEILPEWMTDPEYIEKRKQQLLNKTNTNEDK
ncbi:replication initiation and membrane attachment family protein [Bacillus salitolerans]|uniref:Replication initiation and membrane attachment family protein n=1 Tax=Bacillus salitolerans TaxID=1437434 RepID=A0ABW4LR27_9BACI